MSGRREGGDLGAALFIVFVLFCFLKLGTRVGKRLQNCFAGRAIVAGWGWGGGGGEGQLSGD